MMAVPYVWCILIVGLSFSSICKAGSIELNDNLKLDWRINATKGTIRFIVTAKIAENGWFMIGLAPQRNYSEKVSFKDISGDGFVVWKGASKENKPIWRLNEVNVDKGTLQTEETSDVHLGKATYDNKTIMLKAIVWRALKTKSDLEIKRGEMVVFGSHGNDDNGNKIKKWKNKMKKLNSADAVQDAFTAVEHVDFFEKVSKHKENKQNAKNGLSYAAAIAEKHWIGVILGISAFLTVLITCSVYCFSKKKKKDEFKRIVSMPLHKDTDFDDEARVAFLQSEET